MAEDDLQYGNMLMAHAFLVGTASSYVNRGAPGAEVSAERHRLSLRHESQRASGEANSTLQDSDLTPTYPWAHLGPYCVLARWHKSRLGGVWFGRSAQDLLSSIKSNTAHACSFAHECSRICARAPTHPPTSWLTCHFLPRRPSPLASAYGASRNNGKASRNCKILETHEVHEPQGVGLPIPAIMWDTINRRGSKIGLTLQTNMQLLML